jgi:hypothetical protein
MATVALPSPTTISPTVPGLPDGAKAVTPSDADIFAQPVAIYVGGAGVVTCVPANGGA